MGFFRNDEHLKAAPRKTAVEYCDSVCRTLAEKANHNKKESQTTFVAIICFTLVAPLLVTLGEGWLWGKAVPASLSVLASFATIWLQLRKPQRLWAIYRRGQRELEREHSHFNFKIGDYEGAADPEKILATKVSEIAFKVHEQWEGLVPDANALAVHAPSASPDRRADNE